MAPDRSWISVANRLSIEYRQGVEEFVGVAKNHLDCRGLWVDLPILDNVRYDRDDVNLTEVHNVNELLHTSSTQFVVDDDEDEENEAEYEDE
ncbi:hypothetical protein L6452_20098 [Arctium lappa]|uniref:Uncharacterized protein n=1 Tax=Arctium lappa TaxID=4217 RepID=A0ACB9BAT1_ARCLA|nr:hypothetical protein L6452_20098 [Arctium lappa]